MRGFVSITGSNSEFGSPSDKINSYTFFSDVGNGPKFYFLHMKNYLAVHMRLVKGF